MHISKFKFNKLYFFAFLLVLFAEIGIATFIKKGFIRSTFGDYLVVILIYCFVKSFVISKPFYVAIGVLIFAFVVEFMQLSNILVPLKLENNILAKTILGSTFHITDLVAYILGITTILIAEYKNYFSIFKS